MSSPVGQLEEAKARALEALRNALADEARRLVWGEGTPRARLVIVGEAPGREEERQGRPFVGRAGRVLDELLRGSGIVRGEVWITNVVKHRPVKVIAQRVRTRAPTAAEIDAERDRLLREISIIGPSVILALGSVPTRALLGRRLPITQARGRWFPGPAGSRLLASFHPAYLFRQSAANRGRLMALSRQDFAAVKQALDKLKGLSVLVSGRGRRGGQGTSAPTP